MVSTGTDLVAFGHLPVMIGEVVEFLEIKPGEWYLDATVGTGGHTQAVLNRGGKVVGIDRDPVAIQTCRERFSARAPEVLLKEGSFGQLGELVKEFGVSSFAGILFDLGLSSSQLDDPVRGFSFQKEGRLDMRMDPKMKVTAADLVNGLTKNELIKLLKTYGEEKHARRLADALVRRRRLTPIQTTTELARLVEEVYGPRPTKIHPATKTFQALRMAVNDELNELKTGLAQTLNLLVVRGRLVVISFHSLEDRLVKKFMKQNAGLKVLTKKPVRPTEEETAFNPRSRSARLRAAEVIRIGF